MALIPFPNVPLLPGVPAIARQLTLPSVSELVNLGLGYLADILFGVAKWGMYDQNDQPALVFDTFISMRLRDNARISSFAVEEGTFASFNKVNVSFDVAIRLAHSGDPVSRATMLDALQTAKEGLELYTVVTPEKIYPSANLLAYSYERNSSTGPSHLIVDLYLEEVRQTALAEFSQTAEPDAAQPQDNGQVQTFPVAPPTTSPMQPLHPA